MRAAEIDTVFLAAPTSTDERLNLIGRYSSGFVYVVARTGVTGMRASVATEVESLVARVRAQTDLPVAVGFGISTPEHVQDVWRYADGAVVGTRLVLEIEQQAAAPDLVERIAQLVRTLRGDAA